MNLNLNTQKTVFIWLGQNSGMCDGIVYSVNGDVIVQKEAEIHDGLLKEAEIHDGLLSFDKLNDISVFYVQTGRWMKPDNISAIVYGQMHAAIIKLYKIHQQRRQ